MATTRKNSNKNKYVLIDHDHTLADKTMWIKPTLERIHHHALSEEDVQFIIFTSMDLRVVSTDIFDENPLMQGGEPTSRMLGVQKIRDIYKQAKKLTNDPTILVLTHIDALQQLKIGDGFDHKYVPAYQKMRECWNKSNMAIDQAKLEKDKQYIDLLLEDFYLSRIDGLIKYALRGKSGGIELLGEGVHSFEPLRKIIECYIENESPDKDKMITCIRQVQEALGKLKNFKGKANSLASKKCSLIIDENLILLQEMVENLTHEKRDLILHCIELLRIQAFSASAKELKENLNQFLSSKKDKFPHVAQSFKVYDVTKEYGDGKVEHCEKFLMSYYFVARAVLDAIRRNDKGDQSHISIDIEYLDDKKTCLEDMHAAVEYYLKCNQDFVGEHKITINLTTIEVIDKQHLLHRIASYTSDKKTVSLEQESVRQELTRFNAIVDKLKESMTLKESLGAGLFGLRRNKRESDKWSGMIQDKVVDVTDTLSNKNSAVYVLNNKIIELRNKIRCGEISIEEVKQKLRNYIEFVISAAEGEQRKKLPGKMGFTKSELKRNLEDFLNSDYLSSVVAFRPPR